MLEVPPRLTATQHVDRARRHVELASPVSTGAAPTVLFLVPVVEGIPPRPDVAILVGALTFALMGTLVGFQSPGRTIREAVIALQHSKRIDAAAAESLLAKTG